MQWRVDGQLLHLNWEETGGPPVVPPERKGFGSRLLEELVVRDLGGETRFDYAVSGLKCRITASL